MSINGGNEYLDRICITLRNKENSKHNVYIDVFNNSLSKKWLNALNKSLSDGLHLEKNYCWLGFSSNERSLEFLCDQINQAIKIINQANLGYNIDDYFSVRNTIDLSQRLIHDKLNMLHRYFEDLQGTSSNLSSFYKKANPKVKWHIRQLNLLCHEYESLALSIRKLNEDPEWQRPSTLLCWLNSQRFALSEEDLDLFGIETINRHFGGVYVGVNKAVGKTHWEVWRDENQNLDSLTTTVLSGQTIASCDFDIEWGKNPGEYHWQKKELAAFKQWLIDNKFNPEDKSLTIGHPKIGQVDLLASFNTDDFFKIWNILNNHMDINMITTSEQTAIFDYRWSDSDYASLQIGLLK